MHTCIRIHIYMHTQALGIFCLMSSPGSVQNLALTSYLHFVHHSFTHAHNVKYC